MLQKKENELDPGTQLEKRPFAAVAKSLGSPSGSVRSSDREVASSFGVVKNGFWAQADFGCNADINGVSTALKLSTPLECAECFVGHLQHGIFIAYVYCRGFRNLPPHQSDGLSTLPIKHRPPTATTNKFILGASGNQCAFTSCPEVIVDREHSVIVGRIAHIRARQEGGPRFDHAQTEAENRSASNLVALCGKHHDIVDQREDIYTHEKMTAMKAEHEEKVEYSTDRSWIRFPNSSSKSIRGLDFVTVHYWIDRTGRQQIYTDRKLAIARTAFSVYQDINRLCQLYEMVEQNPQAPASSCMQTNSMLNKKQAALDDLTPWSAIAQILCQMAEIPEVTLGELVTFVVEGRDATSLFVNREQVLAQKIKRLANAT